MRKSFEKKSLFETILKPNGRQHRTEKCQQSPLKHLEIPQQKMVTQLKEVLLKKKNHDLQSPWTNMRKEFQLFKRQIPKPKNSNESKRNAMKSQDRIGKEPKRT